MDKKYDKLVKAILDVLPEDDQPDCGQPLEDAIQAVVEERRVFFDERNAARKTACVSCKTSLTPTDLRAAWDALSAEQRAETGLTDRAKRFARLNKAEAERDAARESNREAAQILVAAFGADGPMSIVKCARRAVGVAEQTRQDRDAARAEVERLSTLLEAAIARAEKAEAERDTATSTRAWLRAAQFRRALHQCVKTLKRMVSQCREAHAEVARLRHRPTWERHQKLQRRLAAANYRTVALRIELHERAEAHEEAEANVVELKSWFDHDAEAVDARADHYRIVLEGFAEGDCEYGDNCPAQGTRHGQCTPCRAREALAAPMLDPATPESVVEDECRKMGVDPEKLADEGAAFVANLRATAAEVRSWPEARRAAARVAITPKQACGRCGGSGFRYVAADSIAGEADPCGHCKGTGDEPESATGALEPLPAHLDHPANRMALNGGKQPSLCGTCKHCDVGCGDERVNDCLDYEPRVIAPAPEPADKQAEPPTGAPGELPLEIDCQENRREIDALNRECAEATAEHARELTTGAPERLWCWPRRLQWDLAAGDGVCSVSRHGASYIPQAEYIRQDIHDQAIAQARREERERAAERACGLLQIDQSVLRDALVYSVSLENEVDAHTFWATFSEQRGAEAQATAIRAIIRRAILEES